MNQHNMNATHVFSIGLNVGDREPVDQLARTLQLISLAYPCRVLEVAMGRSEWEGVPERFLQVALEVPAGATRLAARLAESLRQHSIAMLDLRAPHPHNKAWALVSQYGTAYPGGSLTEFPVLFSLE